MEPELIEGEDFYFDESGYMVLTESYHLQRGSCCGNGCRHCPFDHINVPAAKRDVVPPLNPLLQKESFGQKERIEKNE